MNLTSSFPQLCASKLSYTSHWKHSLGDIKRPLAQVNHNRGGGGVADTAKYSDIVCAILHVTHVLAYPYIMFSNDRTDVHVATTFN